VVLGGGDYYTDEGYIGTSWTAHYRVKVFIEPDGVGGMSVWSRARMDFHEDSIIRGHGLGHTTVSSIMDAAEEAGVVEYYNMDKEGLQAMLDRFQVAA
jgi:hypothetical protein